MLNLAMLVRLLGTLVLLTGVVPAWAAGRQLDALSSVPLGGMPLAVIASAAPDDPDRLIVCTFEADEQRARHHSAAYISLDTGRSWMRTLLDATSDFVAEGTCAAGANGRAYFVASASDTSAGDLAHARGVMQAYRSLNGGLDWSAPRRYPFVDWMSLAVQPTGAAAERVHLFANNIASGIGDAGDGKWDGRRRPLLISEDGLLFAPPLFPPDQVASRPVGSFPLSAVVMEDGSLRALHGMYAPHADPRNNPGAWWYEVYGYEGQVYRAVGRVEPLPVRVEPLRAHPPLQSGPRFLSGQMALDRRGAFKGRLYVAFPALDGDLPVLGLARSDDGGKSWRAEVLRRGLESWRVAGPPGAYAEHAGIAVNAAGVVAIEWQPARGCPVFLTSSDGGETVGEVWRLGRCDDSAPGTAQAASIGARVTVITSRRPIPGQGDAQASPGFDLRVRTGRPSRVQSVADAAGRFHVFWAEPRGDGSVALLSATVPPEAPAARPRVSTGQATELTDRTLVKVQEQRFEPDTATFSIDASVQNIGEAPIRSPTLLQVLMDQSDCGEVHYVNASALAEDGRPVFRISSRVDRPYLSPGDSTLPVHLRIRVPGCEASRVSLQEWARRSVKPGLEWSFLLRARFRVWTTERD
jgi:hypothetical protein